MNLINEMSLSFPSKSSNEAFARSAVSAFVIGLDPTVAELSDIKTAVSEAVTNCIVHGYRRESGTVYINGKIYENNKVVIKIRDKGCGIADIEKAMEPLFTTAPEEDMIELMRQEPGLLRDWDEQYGDRMLKIVFIGQNMDKEQIIRDLDKCLE